MMRSLWHRLLVTVLIIALFGGAVAVAAATAAADSAKVVPKGKMTLAWHVNIATRWLDPQEHDGTATTDNFMTAIHDALIKNQGTVLYDHPALAERFEFNGPFLDFPLIFGTANVSGAGWIVPAKYYQQVGPDGFKQKPIGAGPYKLVRQEPGTKLEFEAFEYYYRPVHVKQLVMISVPEGTTRVAMLERGEADLMYQVPGELIDRLQKNSKIMLAPVLSGSWWLEFPGFQNPQNPFHDKRVRQAVSLAVDRQAINEAEMAGFGKDSGNWINSDVQYAIAWPAFERDLEQARQLMREAGYPNGFEVDWLTPVPTYYSRGESVVAQLGEIGIRAKLQVMERAVFLQKLQGGLKEWPGVQIIFNGTRMGGTWSSWYEAFFKCGGFNARDRLCVQELDGKFAQYEQSINPAERQKLAEEIQRGILENLYFVPVFRHAFVNAIGPRIAAQKWQD